MSVTYPNGGASQVFRDTDGGSDHSPLKSEIRALLSKYESELDLNQEKRVALDLVMLNVTLTQAWDPTTGSFPASAAAGQVWLVTADGTVDSVAFVSGQIIMALVADASTTTYAGNWHKVLSAQDLLDASTAAAADAVSTAADAAATAADAVATAADRVQTGLDAAATAADAVSTAADAATASSSASTATAAQTAAEAARDATLAAYDSFDDRYLGAKASNPTLDNDGNALVAGSLYYNTTVPEMRIYTGSAWVAAYVSGAGVLLVANDLSDLNDPATARGNLGVAIGVDVQSHSMVSVKDFGAVGDGVTDDLAAFNAASDYCEANGIKSLIIPAGSYHLSDYWHAPHDTLYSNVLTFGYGATVDETVVVGSGSVQGLRVVGSPDAGFVFLRGQHSYHTDLIAESCHYGFYFGIASRQYLTVPSTSGFQVGETVTGGTSGADGVVKAISGNVLKLVACNTGDAAKFFQAAETITGGTSGASTTVSSAEVVYSTKHGFNNYQVTRSTWVQCTAYDTINKSWFWDGSATANKSWMNACTIVNPSSVNTGGKGWRVSLYAGPSGDNEHNYNVFQGINIEGGLSPYSTQPQAAPGTNRSLEDVVGRQNTYIGGHFVNQDSSGESVLISDAYNFILGGRYTGTQSIDAPFKFYNTDAAGEGGIIASITATDVLETAASATVKLNGTTYQANGWSMIPQSLLTYTKASDNLTNHTLDIDLSGLGVANKAIVKVFFGGQRNQSAAYNQTAHFNLNLMVSMQTSGSGGAKHVDYSSSGSEGCTISSVVISSGGVVTITFDTTHEILTGISTGDYYDEDSTNIVN